MNCICLNASLFKNKRKYMCYIKFMIIEKEQNKLKIELVWIMIKA